jgi:hypothetical protein
MCIFQPPSMPAVDPSLEAERKERMAQETAQARQRRDDALDDEVARRKKGVGARSLLSGPGGGIGFYNAYRNE